MRDSCEVLRKRGNDAFKAHDLYTAKNYYIQALNQLKKLTQICKGGPEWVNGEYARISANLSLVELTMGHLAEALAAAMESIRTNPTWAKVSTLPSVHLYQWLYCSLKSCSNVRFCLGGYLCDSDHVKVEWLPFHITHVTAEKKTCCFSAITSLLQ